MMADEPALLGLFAQRNLGVLTTIKRNGRPQLSNVNYWYDADARLFKMSVTDDRAKVANLRRDPRASLYTSTPNGWNYAVVEGVVELSSVASQPDDAAVEELIDLFRHVQGEHPDWDDYRRAMVADRRLVARLPVGRAYGAIQA